MPFTLVFIGYKANFALLAFSLFINNLLHEKWQQTMQTKIRDIICDPWSELSIPVGFWCSSSESPAVEWSTPLFTRSSFLFFLPPLVIIQLFLYLFFFLLLAFPCITRYNDLFLIEQWGDSLSSIVLPIAEKKRAPPLASETST